MKVGNKVAACAIASACVFGAFGIVGCSSGAHEVIDQGKSCSSCHSGEKETFEVASPAGAVATSGTVNVKTSADEVLVCNPVFTSSDGSRFVPEEVSSQAVSDGAATLELSEGTWAVCTNANGSVKAKVVTVSPDAAGSADVEL